jgi:hypothetical protein
VEILVSIETGRLPFELRAPDEKIIRTYIHPFHVLRPTHRALTVLKASAFVNPPQNGDNVQNCLGWKITSSFCTRRQKLGAWKSETTGNRGIRQCSR